MDSYTKAAGDRKAEGLVPLPLNADNVSKLVEELKNPEAGEESSLMDLLENRIPPGVDEAAYVKAGFLSAVAKGEAKSPIVDRAKATELLDNGGYNISTLVELLKDPELSATVAKCLSTRSSCLTGSMTSKTSRTAATPLPKK